MSVYLKDPTAVIDYEHDWSALLTEGETISTSTWSVTPSGALTVESDSETDTTATVMVSGGTVGQVIRLTNQIVTSAGRTDERTIVVRVEHC